MPDTNKITVPAGTEATAPEKDRHEYQTHRGSKIDLHDFMERNYRCDMSMQGLQDVAYRPSSATSRK